MFPSSLKKRTLYALTNFTLVRQPKINVHIDSPASIFYMLGLQAYATVPTFTQVLGASLGPRARMATTMPTGISPKREAFKNT